MISYKIDTPKTKLPFGNRLETVYADMKGLIWVGFFEAWSNIILQQEFLNTTT